VMNGEKYICRKCGNDSFHLYDIGLKGHIEWKLVCSKCGEIDWMVKLIERGA
jgi:predicted nucleic-acid-binding Zn-ribbon protein